MMAFPKRGIFRSKAFLSIVHEVDCVMCGRYKSYTQAAHGGPAFGKGGAMKASDASCSALCMTCHVSVDSGKDMLKAERREFINTAICRTYRELARLRLITGATFPDLPDDELAQHLVSELECGVIAIPKNKCK